MQLEEMKLKKKVNSLIDKITTLNDRLSEKESHIKLLSEEIKMLKVQENSSGAEQEVHLGEESEMFSFIKDFCMIARLIIQNEAYIKYRYETKYSGDFYKIDQVVFEDYICKYAGIDLKTFIGYCVDLALVKSEKNKKCLYNSGEIRVYYVSRPFIEAAIKKEQQVVC